MASKEDLKRQNDFLRAEIIGLMRESGLGVTTYLGQPVSYWLQLEAEAEERKAGKET